MQGEFLIRIDDQVGGDSLRSLARWLRDDEVIRTSGAITLERPLPAEAEMGAGLDLVKFVAETGFSTANLVLAVATWRQSRSSKPSVTIEQGEARVAIESSDPDAVARAAKSLGGE